MTIPVIYGMLYCCTRYDILHNPIKKGWWNLLVLKFMITITLHLTAMISCHLEHDHIENLYIEANPILSAFAIKKALIKVYFCWVRCSFDHEKCFFSLIFGSHKQRCNYGEADEEQRKIKAMSHNKFVKCWTDRLYILAKDPWQVSKWLLLLDCKYQWLNST